MYQSPAAEPLIAAKFAVPPLPPVHHPRTRLTDRLADPRRAALTSVTGPAGAGKTTLVSHWVRTRPEQGPVAWLTLDHNDNSPGIFWSYLVHAILGRVPHLGGGITAPTHVNEVDDGLLGRLAAGLAAQPTPLTLVLDRAETVINRAIGVDLAVLLRRAQRGLALVVVGRHADHLMPDRIRPAGSLTRIDGDALALAPDETAAIVAGHGVRLSLDQIEALQSLTGGWMTGVCLHALGARSGTGPAGFPHPAGHQAVAEFLRSEVLDAQPAGVRHLLLRTSVPDELDVDLAIQLSGRADAAAMLTRLHQANAFVRRVRAGRFRYDRPFRDLLRGELATCHPGLVPGLHEQAAEWFAAHGRGADALDHAVRVGAWDRASAVAVRQLGVAWLLTSAEAEAERHRSTLVDLPAAAAAPAAQVLRAILALAELDIPAARAAADRAAVTLRRLDGQAGPLVLALRSTQVTLGRYTGDASYAAAMAAEADAVRKQLDPAEVAGEPALHALILSNLGVALCWGGRLHEGWAALSRAAAATGPGTEYMVHDALAHLALLSLHYGKVREAEAYARRSLDAADRAGLRSTVRVGAASVVLAATAQIWQDPPAVREHLARALAAASSRVDPPTAVATALIRARTAVGRGDGRRALALLHAAAESIDGWRPAREVTEAFALSAVRAHLALGDTTAARHSLRSVSDGPARALATGRLLAAEGDPTGACRILLELSGQQAAPEILIESALTIGGLAFGAGDAAAAGSALAEALDLAQAQWRRQPFVEAGAWVHQILRHRPELAERHNWLAPPVVAGDGGGTAPVLDALTGREVDVLSQLADGLSTEDIAGTLRLSVNTVKTHLKSVYRKLGVSGRSAAARRARARHLRPGAVRDPPP
ncbi:MAG TPA: LuxR C-terminal-related transcriptional regulator [Pilimelia sp.]|nr:LuxR C-terminal-related transcriptional regulator [Pilimelia sp.]